MVLIRDIVREQREGERRQIQERLPDKLRELARLAETADSMKKLRSIEGAVNRLISGKRDVPEEVRRKQKEKRKQHYAENKDDILGKQKKKRSELRRIAQQSTPEKEKPEVPKGEWDVFQEKWSL
jgi:hypothetical protein